jgi:Na+/H+ antiporter NhaD/arsenite permease-like protein
MKKGGKIMEFMNWLFLVLFFGLIVLFFVSFTLFIRRSVYRSMARNERTDEVEAKLDRILAHLEKPNK